MNYVKKCEKNANFFNAFRLEISGLEYVIHINATPTTNTKRNLKKGRENEGDN